MDMHHENVGDYVIHNTVTVLEPGRAIAWQPGQYDDQGTWGSGGWWWRYDLEPVEDGTRVTLTYDWADVPEPVRQELRRLPGHPAGLPRGVARGARGHRGRAVSVERPPTNPAGPTHSG